MAPITPPSLFGIDPDETWNFTPPECEGMEDPIVIKLKTPDAALDELIEEEDMKIHLEARKAVPEVVATLQRIEKIKPEDRTEDDKAAFAQANEAFILASVAAAEKVDRLALQRRALGACVVGWNLKTRSGKPVEFPSKPEEIIDRMSKALRASVFAAIKRGATITKEEQVSLT